MENTQPKQKCSLLKCIVTGKSRLTNKKYLQDKATAANITVEEYLSLYISREALKALRQNKSVEDVRKELNATATEPISAELLAKAIKVNGKWGKK
jgi:hypothetical protein